MASLNRLFCENLTQGLHLFTSFVRLCVVGASLQCLSTTTTPSTHRSNHMSIAFARSSPPNGAKYTLISAFHRTVRIFVTFQTKNAFV